MHDNTRINNMTDPSTGEKIKAIIIDDEPMACENLAFLLNSIREIDLMQSFTEAMEALKYLADEPADLIFLDMQMPRMNGFEFLDKLKEFPFTPTIIFVTGFEEYAIKAIKRAAFDFLLKPVNTDELNESLLRYKLLRNQNHEKQKIDTLLKSLNHREKIKFKSKNGFHLIDPEEIFYIESEGNYSWIHLTNANTEMVTMQIGKIHELLNQKDFFRISRTHLVNLRYLYKVDKKRGCCYLKLLDKIIEFNMVKSKINHLLLII